MSLPYQVIKSIVMLAAPFALIRLDVLTLTTERVSGLNRIWTTEVKQITAEEHTVPFYLVLQEDDDLIPSTLLDEDLTCTRPVCKSAKQAEFCWIHVQNNFTSVHLPCLLTTGATSPQCVRRPLIFNMKHFPRSHLLNGFNLKQVILWLVH